MHIQHDDHSVMTHVGRTSTPAFTSSADLLSTQSLGTVRGTPTEELEAEGAGIVASDVGAGARRFGGMMQLLEFCSQTTSRAGLGR